MPLFLPEKSVVPVIRMSAMAPAFQAVQLLEESGMGTFEITLTTPGALEVIASLKASGRARVGAGTVLSADEARRSIDAGADFIVSPALRREVAEVCATHGVACVLGAATPSEILAAHEAGAAMVKVFPAAQLGGPGFLKAIGSVLPQIRLMPTGGIAVGDIAAYFAAGAICLGMGGRLADERAITEDRPEDIRAAGLDVQAELAKLAGEGEA